VPPASSALVSVSVESATAVPVVGAVCVLMFCVAPACSVVTVPMNSDTHTLPPTIVNNVCAIVDV
jgi:hypothetical protein